MSELHYISAWIIRGATELHPAGEYALIASANPRVRVVLTSDLQTWADHLDRSASILEVIFSAGLADTPQKVELRRLALETARANRSRDFASGLFMVLDAVRASNRDLPDHRKLDDFGVAIDAFDNDRVRDEFRPFLTGAFAAVQSALPADSDRRLERVGAAIFLVDPADGRPIYNFNLRMGSPTVSINATLNAERIPAMARRAALLVQHQTLSKVTRLMHAATIEQEAYGRFLLSWGALEMFVHSTFAERYDTLARTARADAASALGQAMKPYLRDGYDGFPVRARFVAIAHALAPGDLAADNAEFGALKDARDRFIHSGDLPDLDDHMRRSRALLLKLLGLELATRA
jgi:hypothetical protein